VIMGPVNEDRGDAARSYSSAWSLPIGGERRGLRHCLASYMYTKFNNMCLLFSVLC